MRRFDTGLIIISVLLLVALVLQLLPLLTVPISSRLTLCTYQNYAFGVFGYCSPDGCRFSYNVSISDSGFALPSNTKRSIAKLLVVHIISFVFTAVYFVLSVLLNIFNMNLKFLIFLLLWSLVTFLLNLLTFLVDILLFSPYLNWIGWLLLATPVIIAVSSASICLIRRNLSSRLAIENSYKLLNNQSYYYENQDSENFNVNIYHDDDTLNNNGNNNSVPNPNNLELRELGYVDRVYS